MDVSEKVGTARTTQAMQVIRKLDELGAVKLDVLVARASEIQGIAGLDGDDRGICYPFYVRIGPRADLDLVSVAAQLKDLGFELKRPGQIKG